MTKAEREQRAREQFACPRVRCGAAPGRPCRYRVPQYTPLGVDHPRYGTPMVHVHPERLALVPEEEPMPKTDDRPEPEGRGTDARLARWVKANVPDARVRADGTETVTYQGGALYALLHEVAEHFYWQGTEDVRDHPARMAGFFGEES